MSDRTGDPTEEPTQRRWEKSFEDGQLAFSSDLIGGLIVLVGVLFFMYAGRWFFDCVQHFHFKFLFQLVVGSTTSGALCFS